jgi:hypothetical protein
MNGDSSESAIEITSDGRPFREGDILRLHQVPFGGDTPTGATCEREVTYIVHGGQFGVKKGLCRSGVHFGLALAVWPHIAAPDRFTNSLPASGTNSPTRRV